MHNNIMAAGSRDRPPMLATGRYAQWRSRFLRYIDTRPNGDALRKCILTGPYIPTMVTTPAVPATEDSPEVPAKTSVETVLNMTPENKAHYESEKEAIHLILTGIGDEIYSTVDACVQLQAEQFMMASRPRMRKLMNKSWERFLMLLGQRFSRFIMQTQALTLCQWNSGNVLKSCHSDSPDMCVNISDLDQHGCRITIDGLIVVTLVLGNPIVKRTICLTTPNKKTVASGIHYHKFQELLMDAIKKMSKPWIGNGGG
ncbi:hypothetical protein Tco_0481472 [Tanacetum coccineum]